jgi:FkbM family methyltransferase
MPSTLSAMSSRKSRKKHRGRVVLIVGGILTVCVLIAAAWVILLVRMSIASKPAAGEGKVVGRTAHPLTKQQASRPRIVEQQDKNPAAGSTKVRVGAAAAFTAARAAVPRLESCFVAKENNSTTSTVDANSVLVPSFNSTISIQDDIRLSLDCDGTSLKMNTNSAKALFCEVAALGRQDDKSAAATTIETNKARNDHIWQVWVLARAIMSTDTLHTLLSCSVKQDATLLKKHKVQLWAPKGDIGITTVLKELNSGNKVAEYGFESLPPGSLGPGKLYIDAGSNLGLVSLLVSLRYPETDVISIEAAAPTWLLQQLNLRLNLPLDGYFDRHIVSVQAGLGATDGEVFPMMWRPSSTTSTRGWTPKAEHNKDNDIELQVKLRSLRSILVEFNRPPDAIIDFLKIDCEGCEYNLIPSMTTEEFDAVRMGVGELHWGYIPDAKKPSSERARQTHERLCRFQNFASQAKECCAFPDLPVIDAHNHQELNGGVANTTDNSTGMPTVKAIAGAMCHDFDSWVMRQRLLDIPDDKGWLNTESSMA